MKRVEMLGAGMSFGDIPPFAHDAERWGTNNVMFARYGGNFDAWTRWFDLHPTAHIQRRRPQAYEWYCQQDASRPIYQWHHNPDLPGSAVYPLERVLEFFGDAADELDFVRYPVRREGDFWGSIGYLIALAILEQFTHIDLFWFVLANDRMNTYAHQVPSTRYWIGQARGRGIRVTIHGDSALKPHHQLYGYEELAPDLVSA